MTIKNVIYDVIRYPHITEKTTTLSQFNKYVFKVDMLASKNVIKAAISKIFNVKVKDVNTVKMKGKIKKFKGKLGKRVDFKKAIVTLEPGQQIDTSAEV